MAAGQHALGTTIDEITKVTPSNTIQRFFT